MAETIQLVGRVWDSHDGTIHHGVEIDSEGDILLEDHPTLRKIGDEVYAAYAWRPGEDIHSDQTYRVVPLPTKEELVNNNQKLTVTVTVEGAEELYNVLDALRDYTGLDDISVQSK